MRKSLCGWLTGAALLLLSTAAGAQEWVQFKQQGAEIHEYRVADRDASGNVPVVVRRQCQLYMREETRTCTLALDVRRAWYSVFEPNSVIVDKPQPDAYRIFWSVASLSVDCARSSFRLTVEEFYDVKVQLVTRVESPKEWIEFVSRDPDFIHVVGRVCR